MDKAEKTTDTRTNAQSARLESGKLWRVSDIAPYAVYSGTNRIADCREANCVCYTERDQRNARLIAAAPDLLDACKIGLAAMIAWGGKCEAAGEAILARESVMKAETIRAAIAKAEGSAR